MIVTKKYLRRRTVLRGLGATVALPLLDGMIPAFAGRGFAAAQPIRRLMVTYAGNGMTLGEWTPPKEGPLVLSPILQSLEPVKDRTLVIAGLDSHPVDLSHDGGIHPRCQAAWLTGMPAKKSDSDLEVGISMDQIAAREIGQDTQLTSLELAMESAEGLTGNCAFGYGCAYNNTIAWKTATTPLPMETNPRAVFERMFGASDSTDAKVRLAQIRKNRSILDAVTESVASMQPRMSTDDRHRMGQYLESVRDVERRIQRAEAAAGQELPVVDQPVGIPASFEEHARVLLDLLVLAFQTDLTRVSTYLIARELSNKAYPEIGVPDSHHPLSHHGNQPERMARLAKLNAFHMQQFAYYVQKLAATPDGDGTLLDHTISFYGSGISNSNQHDPHNLPLVVVGGQAAGIKGGRHVRYPSGTPIANFYLAILDKMGARVDRIGDSTGELNLLSGL